MDNRSSTDIDRKLAIYYHPLFQEIIKNVLILFKIPIKNNFEIGLLQFIEFNLKLQKSLLPEFEIENALVSALNDWVKQVAQCLTYEGMISTSKCEEITGENMQYLLQKQLKDLQIDTFTSHDQYLKTLLKLGSHDAFKLIGVKINKEVFSKFMFDLCSTWCEFLDIQLFCYFLVGIYIQLSEGQNIQDSNFKSTVKITPIQLDFMEAFEDLKNVYSKSHRKQLRYYRAWCEWNYLRINEIGEALILELNEIHVNDPRVLELAKLFQSSIQVINEEITNQNVNKIDHKEPLSQNNQAQLKSQEDTANHFLILKKLDVNNGNKRAVVHDNQVQQAEITRRHMELMESQHNFHNFEIEIDPQGNMYLRRIVKLPILGQKIIPLPFENKSIEKMRYVEMKKESMRMVSNLYKRLDPMKVRLEHTKKNDHYVYKPLTEKMAEREQFYSKNVLSNQLANNRMKPRNQYTNVAIDKIIHGKIVKNIEDQSQIPEKEEGQSLSSLTQTQNKHPISQKQEKEPLRKNQQYIHKIMAPSFLTDDANNLHYAKGQNYVYGVSVHSQKRDLKINLPKIKYIDSKFEKIDKVKSYHLVGKLANNREQINNKLRSISTITNSKSKFEEKKQQYEHLYSKYLNDEEVRELNNYNKLYSKLQEIKKQFNKDYQSEYRLNLKEIFLYENKRYEMGGFIEKKEQDKFYQRMQKLIKKDNKKSNRRRKKLKFRQYKKMFKNREGRSLFQDIFVNYHKDAIRTIKQDRTASFAK